MAEQDVFQKRHAVSFEKCCGMVVESDAQTGEVLGISTDGENGNMIRVGEDVYAKETVSISFLKFAQCSGTRAKVIAIRKPADEKDKVVGVQRPDNVIRFVTPDEIIQLD